MTRWTKRTDAELRLLAEEIREGRVVGTWEYPAAPARKEVFPDFDAQRHWSHIVGVSEGAYYSSPGAAEEWSSTPRVAEGFVYSDGENEPPFEFSRLELLSLEEWTLLAPLIGAKSTL